MKIIPIIMHIFSKKSGVSVGLGQTKIREVCALRMKSVIVCPELILVQIQNSFTRDKFKHRALLVLYGQIGSINTCQVQVGVT